LEGWLHKDWESIQQKYYKLIQSRQTSKRWMAAVITKLWEIAWDLWEHRNDVMHCTVNEV